MDKSSAPRWDWTSAALLFLLVQLAAARLVTTNWAPFLFFAEIVAALGSVLGMALAISRFGRRVIIWFVIDYSLVVIPWQLSTAADSKLSFADHFLFIGNALLISLNQFLGGQLVKDSFFFVAVVSIAFWFIALAAGYWLIRHRNMLAAIIPSGIAILLIQAYDDLRVHSSWWLAFYLLFTLLLLGRQYYLNNEIEWRTRHLAITDESWPHIFSGLAITVTLAVFISWSIPTSLSSLQEANQTWSDFTKPIRDRLSNAVDPLSKSSGNGSGVGGLNSSMELGTQAATGDQQVFLVETINGASSSRYYWRGQVYDSYNNGIWSTSPASSMDFKPGDPNLNIPNSFGRTEVRMQFTYQWPEQNLLYSPSETIWIDQSGQVMFTPVDPKMEDVLTWHADPPIQSGGHYQVIADVADPTIEDLSSAGTNYPDWVKNRYLQIPDNIHSQIQTLAEQITANATDPYQKATAVTSYLRANLSYVTSVPQAPQGTDPLIYILFDYKKGFCNYYASAEVMLLRSLGIPARLAVGYAQGEYQAGVFTVRQHDLHAWPEVYFPNIGWVEFEPTANQDALSRPHSQNQDASSPNSVLPPKKPASEGDATPPAETPDTKTATRPFWQTLPLWLIAALIFIPVLGALIFAVIRFRVVTLMPAYLSKIYDRSGIGAPAWIQNWERWNQLSPIERDFDIVNTSLRWLGRRTDLNATPNERAALLKKYLPEAGDHIEALKAELESELFTPHPANLSRARSAHFFILMLTIRHIASNFLGLNDGVYSG